MEIFDLGLPDLKVNLDSVFEAQLEAVVKLAEFGGQELRHNGSH